VELGPCRDALERAVEAAARCGLDTTPAKRTLATISERSGFPGDLYVLALVGGTGVGKSSLLNALAGAEVSVAGVRRPTTDAPVAWVPASRLEDAQRLIDWLGGATIRERMPDDGPAVAVLDLPDLDSIEPAHAARVDAVLPKLDAVAWVTDLEKYQDAVLHDVYLRRWMRRLARQALVLNKSDRLAPGDAGRVAADLRNRLESEGLSTPTILLTSATSDVGELRRWLADGVEAKRIVTARLAAEARAAVAGLAGAAGIDPEAEPSPLIPGSRRAAALAAVTHEVVTVVDLTGVERQAVAATRLAAAPRGGGPVGLVRSLLERGTGVSERRADPEGYLRRWRERGTLERAVKPLRDLIAEAMPELPPRARAGIAPLAAGGEVSAHVAGAIDRSIGGPGGRFEVPSSRLWPLLGIGQLIATAAVALAVIWLLAAIVVGGVSGSVDVPVLGPMPTPVALLAGGVVAWFLLGRLLRWHAGWLGRRWAAGLTADVRREVGETVSSSVLRPLDAYESARRDLWHSVRDALAAGGHPGDPERT
jgi:GTP-binding protein EngB required for normal cell division